MKTNSKKGFVVLYTVLIASVILAIVVGITTVSYSEVVLSAEAREGNISFFAADSGAECALYWDRSQGVFIGETGGVSLSCNNREITITIPPLIQNSYSFDLPLDQGCAKITVMKGQTIETIDPNNPGAKYTKIESRGYNVPCEKISDSPRVIERAIRVTYAESQIIMSTP